MLFLLPPPKLDCVCHVCVKYIINYYQHHRVNESNMDFFLCYVVLLIFQDKEKRTPKPKPTAVNKIIIPTDSHFGYSSPFLVFVLLSHFLSVFCVCMCSLPIFYEGLDAESFFIGIGLCFLLLLVSKTRWYTPKTTNKFFSLVYFFFPPHTQKQTSTNRSTVNANAASSTLAAVAADAAANAAANAPQVRE